MTKEKKRTISFYISLGIFILALFFDKGDVDFLKFLQATGAGIFVYLIVLGFLNSNYETKESKTKEVKMEKQNSVNEQLDGFQSEFSLNQKRAIMCSLFLIANSDGEFHYKEQRLFEKIAMLIGYQTDTDIDSKLDDIMTMDRDKLFIYLNSLNESQKDWFIVTSFEMVHVDGKALENEVKYMITIFQQMNITEDRFEKVIKKTQNIMDKFA